MDYCPRCDRRYKLPPPGGTFICDRMQLGDPPTTCFVIEHWYELQMENRMVEARDPLLQEREKTHGDYVVTATAAQALKNELRNWNTKGLKAPQIEALEMICLKMARALQRPKVRDHWDDIAGYAKLGAEACDG
jgi:Domain of unknown function (DUF6378)